MRKVKIYLYGKLRKLVPHVVEVNAETAAEAIQFLSHNYPELKPPLDIGRWPVRIKGYETKESLFVPLFTDELHIFPFFGFQKSAWVTIGIGVLLIAGAIWLAPAAGALATAKVGSATWFAALGSNFLMYTGIGLIGGAITQMLSPTPSMNTTVEKQVEGSKYLGAPKNTIEAGTRIPICYGLFKVSGHYISYDINAVDTIKKTTKSKGQLIMEQASGINSGNVEVVKA